MFQKALSLFGADPCSIAVFVGTKSCGEVPIYKYTDVDVVYVDIPIKVHSYYQEFHEEAGKAGSGHAPDDKKKAKKSKRNTWGNLYRCWLIFIIHHRAILRKLFSKGVITHLKHTIVW